MQAVRWIRWLLASPVVRLHCFMHPTPPAWSQDALESIVEMREHDVPYHVRFEIDTDTRCGHWFTVRAKVGGWG
jgi:DNA polymerase elongation subunit (family B)